MTNTTRALSISLLVVAVAACGKGNNDDKASGKVVEGTAASEPSFVTCDAAKLDALAADFAKANCLDVDLSVKAITDACEVTKKQLMGKTYALKGCTFSHQGNDEVSFGATGTDKTLGCVMKGGEAGVKDFRDSAMKLDMDKLRLDVIGVISVAGTKGFERLQMTDCRITAHD